MQWTVLSAPQHAWSTDLDLSKEKSLNMCKEGNTTLKIDDSQGKQDPNVSLKTRLHGPFECQVDAISLKKAEQWAYESPIIEQGSILLSAPSDHFCMNQRLGFVEGT